MTSAPTRRRLPNRCAHLVLAFEHRQPAEIFLTTNKHGSLVDINARYAAIAASLLLQHGCPLVILRRVLTRNSDGFASGPLAHVLDLLNLGAAE